MKQEYFVSLIVPLHNDALALNDFLVGANEILQKSYTMYEVLLIDDDSHDDTVNIIEAILQRIPCVRYFRLAKHYGKEAAISAGLDSAIGDFVVIMNLRRDPAVFVPEMVLQAVNENSIVYGVEKGKRRGIFSYIVSSAFYWYCNRFLHIHILKHATDFIALPRKSVSAMIKVKHLNHYLKLFSYYTGLRNQEFPYHSLGNKKDDSFIDKAKTGIDIIISNSSHPLRFVTFLGLFASIVNIGYMGYVLFIYFLKRNAIEGWTTSSLQISILFFFLFLILTMFSEYLGRIFNELKGKESYMVIEEKSSSVLVPKLTVQKRNIVRNSA